jgi:hypothetical protein
LTPAEFTNEVGLFFMRCMAVMQRKNPDYNPDHAVLLDLVRQCVEEGIAPETALRFLLGKHWTVIRGWTLGNAPQSEPLDSRLVDAANFIAMMAILQNPVVRDGVVAGILRVERTSCACGCVDQLQYNQTFYLMESRPSVRPWCVHGKRCHWLVKLLISLDSSPDSWPMTLKVLVSSRMERSVTGDMSQRVRSLGLTAMPEETPPTTDGRSTPGPDAR